MKAVRIFGSTLTAATMFLSTGCATLQKDAASVDAAVQANAIRIGNFCTNTIVPDLNSPLAQAALGVVMVAKPDVGSAVAGAMAGAKAVCSDISSAAGSATTVDWLQTIDTIIKSGGKTLPAPVAPVAVGS